MPNIPIGPASPQGCYAAAVVTEAPHRETGAEFLSYLTGPPGQASYQRHGFTTDRP